MNTKTPGHAAYEAYCGTRDWKAFDGKALPQWCEQREDLRQAWEIGALAGHAALLARNEACAVPVPGTIKLPSRENGLSTFTKEWVKARYEKGDSPDEYYRLIGLLYDFLSDYEARSRAGGEKANGGGK